jgi:hypothetical protein
MKNKNQQKRQWRELIVGTVILTLATPLLTRIFKNQFVRVQLLQLNIIISTLLGIKRVKLVLFHVLFQMEMVPNFSY